MGRNVLPVLLTGAQVTERHLTPGSLLKKLLRDPIAASRARSLLVYLSEFWLRHNVRFAHVSLDQARAFWLGAIVKKGQESHLTRFSNHDASSES